MQRSTHPLVIPDLIRDPASSFSGATKSGTPDQVRGDVLNLGQCANPTSLDTAIADILDAINDPCSIAAGRPLSVRAMGLVRGWALEDGVLTVTFAVTFAGCTMAPHFTEAAREALAGLPGVERVETVVDTSYVWTPADMPAPPVMWGVPQGWRAVRQD